LCIVKCGASAQQKGGCDADGSNNTNGHKSVSKFGEISGKV
jgi:hypothetical protein